MTYGMWKAILAKAIFILISWKQDPWKLFGKRPPCASARQTLKTWLSDRNLPFVFHRRSAYVSVIIWLVFLTLCKFRENALVRPLPDSLSLYISLSNPVIHPISKKYRLGTVHGTFRVCSVLGLYACEVIARALERMPPIVKYKLPSCCAFDYIMYLFENPYPKRRIKLIGPRVP